MIRTEDDLRTLLHAPIEAGVADRVLAQAVGASRPRAPRRRARIGLVTAAALVIVVGAVFAVVAVRSDPRPSPQPPVASTPDDAPADLSVSTSAVSFPAGSGYRVVGVDLAGAAQSAEVAADGSNDVVAWVRLLEPGERIPAVPRPDRDSVQLASGATASWIPSSSGTALPLGDALRWTTESHLIVTVTPTFDGATDATVLAIAEALQLGAAVPVLVPVAVSHWPSGLGLLGVSTSGGDGVVSIDVGTHVSVRVLDPGLKGVDPDRGTPVVIDGRTWHWDASIGVLTWAGPDRIVQLGPETYSEAPFVSEAEIEDLAAALTFASSYTDRSTWFDVRTALPS